MNQRVAGSNPVGQPKGIMVEQKGVNKMDMEATVSVPAVIVVPDGTISVPAATTVAVPVEVVPVVNEYLLTIRVKIQAMDDMEARARAKTQLGQLGEYVEGWDVKLQAISKSAPPRKVEL